MKRLLLSLIILTILIFPAYAHTPQSDSLDRVILVYMNADNNLYSFGLDDLNEISSASRDTEHVKVFVLFDGPDIGDTKLYEVTPGHLNEIHPLRLSSEMNLGDPSTLRNYLTRAFKAYHAKYYFLDIRDHGGARLGASRDDSDNDHLTLDELKDALNGFPLSILGFDACLMGNIETLYELSQVYRGLVIASIETEPGAGRDYSRLNVLQNPEASPYEVAEAVVDAYVNYYAQNGESGVTLAVYDLSFIDPVIEKLNDLGLLYLLEAYSLYSQFGSILNAGVEISHIEDEIAGDGTEDIHLGENTTAIKIYNVHLEAGEIYTVTLDRNDSADLDLYIFTPGAEISLRTVYADSATYGKPESVTFIANVTGDRQIVVDHYSPETTPTSFVLSVVKTEHGLLDSLLEANPVYYEEELVDLPTAVRTLGLPYLSSILSKELESFVPYHRGVDIESYLSISRKIIRGAEMSDYISLDFASAVPYRVDLVYALENDVAPSMLSVDVSVSTMNVSGYEVVTALNTSSAVDLVLYDVYTGERIELGVGTSFDLREIPNDCYLAYLVNVTNGVIVGAQSLGAMLIGLDALNPLPETIGSSGSVTISGHFSPIYNITIYLNGNLIGTYTPDALEAGVEISGYGNLTIVQGNFSTSVSIVEDSGEPEASISYSASDRIASIEASASDDVALKSVVLYIDGRPYYGENPTIRTTFERNVTIVAEDYASHRAVDQKTIYYDLSEHPFTNNAPSLDVSYTLNKTELTLSINIDDDDPRVILTVYVNGAVVYNNTANVGQITVVHVILEYGNNTVLVVATDPYGGEATYELNLYVENAKPKIVTTYKLEDNMLKLNITVIDDDPQVQLEVYIDGAIVYNNTIETNTTISLEFNVTDGSHHVKIVAIDVINESVYEFDVSPGEAGGGTNVTLIAAIVVIIAILLALIFLLLRRQK